MGEVIVTEHEPTVSPPAPRSALGLVGLRPGDAVGRERRVQLSLIDSACIELGFAVADEKKCCCHGVANCRRLGACQSVSDAAKEHSKCPSGREGGSLGEFSPGMMVPEFDKVVFSEEVGVVHGPIETQFGFHLIEITNRED